MSTENNEAKRWATDILSGRQYGKELAMGEEMALHNLGLVACFGASDDLIEIRGALGADEFEAYGGGILSISQQGVLQDWDNIDHESEKECEEYFRRKGLPTSTLKAEWVGSDEISWRFSIDCPHEKFLIEDEGHAYCEGVIFRVEDLGKVVVP